MDIKILGVTATIFLGLCHNVQAEEQNTVTTGVGIEELSVVRESAKPVESDTHASSADVKAPAPAENISQPEEPAPATVAEPVAEQQSEPEKVSEDKESAQQKEEDKTTAVLKDKQDYDAEISYYIQNMNLSIEQLDMAKQISDDSRLRQKQMMQSIYTIRKQALDLEAQSLAAFEKILTPEQKVKFEELKALQNKERQLFNRLSEPVK